MYNKYTQELISKIPELYGFDSVSCRRILTKAYVFITQLKMGMNKNEVVNDELVETRETLRKLADTMESIAVFDKINGIEISEEVEVACAFVASEALSLLHTLMIFIESPSDQCNDYFFDHNNYLIIETALLYMIGGFDINSTSVVNLLVVDSAIVEQNDYLDLTNSSLLLLRILKSFINGDLTQEIITPINVPLITEEDSYDLLIEKIRVHFYIQLIESLNLYKSWLIGTTQDGVYRSLQILERIRRAASMDVENKNIAFSDIYHFSSLLMVGIQKTQQRSLLHTIPFPESHDEEYKQNFNNYLISRAKGSSGSKGRPFLWPSALAYVNKCLPGPNKDCVITMPTGSGKSFIAEIAIAQAIAKGWVLYLAPTNALVHQIRRDLRNELSELDIKIRSFIGGEEYTTLSEESINFEEKFVAVMTPEKCALALRLYPEYFANCALCIFDECHLINDKNRGTNADILLTRLMNLAENIKFILMSAMISNGKDLSDWLIKVHDENTVCESINWRPTRTLRCIVALDNTDILVKTPPALDIANNLPRNRKHVYFDSSLLFISGLSGPWTLDGEIDYKISKVPMSFPVKVSKGIPFPQFDSWKNNASRLVSEKMAYSGIPVINFILSSKHHAFSAAGKVSIPVEGADIEDLPDLVSCYLTIADRELGLDTILREHFKKGIAVHTSAMLQVEQSASEYIFTKGNAKLMFATGTLAQGLNLPAVAVVISGTSMGDPREADNIYGITTDRAKSTILNAFGRAGRPGFGHQGIAVLVPDNPSQINLDETKPYLIQGSDIMREPDASIEVHSPVENFIDLILGDENSFDFATNEELILASLLAELDNDKNIGETLGNTFGAFKRSNLITQESLEVARKKILEIKEEFIESPDIPDWLNIAGMKAGVDFFRVKEMWEAYKKRGIVLPEESLENRIMDWYTVFIEVLAHMHPKFFLSFLVTEARTETILTKMRDFIITNRILEKDEFVITQEWLALWNELGSIFKSYMNGESYKEIAEKFLRIEVLNNGRSSGAHPIPVVFKFIKEVIDPIAIDAGCFLAINEIGVYKDSDLPVSEELQSLPIALRNGCSNLGVLAWFRFGFRQRMSAHKLNEVFPLPNEQLDDATRAKWVRREKRQFLITQQEDDFLECIRKVILQEN